MPDVEGAGARVGAVRGRQPAGALEGGGAQAVAGRRMQLTAEGTFTLGRGQPSAGERRSASSDEGEEARRGARRWEGEEEDGGAREGASEDGRSGEGSWGGEGERWRSEEDAELMAELDRVILALKAVQEGGGEGESRQASKANAVVL